MGIFHSSHIDIPKWEDFTLQFCYNPKWEYSNLFWCFGAYVEPLTVTKPRNPNGQLRDAEDLGVIIKQRRKDLGLTQQELAKACHCSPRFISELERGCAGGNIKQVIYVCKKIGLDLYAKPRG